MEGLYALRGATGAENSKESVQKNVVEMCLSLFGRNGLSPERVVSIQFTVTPDLTAMNPAMALRRGQNEFDVSNIALFSSQEAAVDGGPEKMIRVLVTCYLPERSELRHVYIHGGERLRPDLAGGSAPLP